MSKTVLSLREMEVLSLIGSCSDNGEIAARLGVSIDTIKTHLSSIYRKLGVSNRVAAALAYNHLDEVTRDMIDKNRPPMYSTVCIRDLVSLNTQAITLNY